MLSFKWDEEVYREALLEEGEERGHKEGALDVARNLKAEGAEKALIMKVSGLTEQEVDSL